MLSNFKWMLCCKQWPHVCLHQRIFNFLDLTSSTSGQFVLIDLPVASGFINERSEEVQVNTLVFCMGKIVHYFFKSFNLSADQSKDYKIVNKINMDHS